MAADLISVHLFGRDQSGVDLFCYLLSCSFHIGRSVKFACRNYSFRSVCLMCRNRFSRHVAVNYMAVKRPLFEFDPSFCQCTAFVFCRLSCFVLLRFSSFVCSPDANGVCEHLNTCVVEHSPPKIANDVCQHANTSVQEHSKPVLTVCGWLMRVPGLAPSYLFYLFFRSFLLRCVLLGEMLYSVRHFVRRF